MSQTSFPKGAASEAPLGENEWKQLMLPLGRGIIDEGGHPYKLTARDSVTNTVTIGVDSRNGFNTAILDGFLHFMDAPENVSVPAVAADTTYEIGLVFDPNKIDDVAGPITLTAWTAPADNTGGKSRLVLYRMTRKNNLALGSTPYTEERPRACPVISVSTSSQLPTNSLVLVDSIGISRSSGNLYRADISESGTISWSQIGGSGGSGSVSASEFDAIKAKVDAATWDKTGSTLMWRGSDGVARVATDTSHGDNILNRFAGDGRYAYKSHQHPGSDITSRVPFEHVDGSEAAWQNTNLGSTWATVAVNSAGFLGRYPSALKYKKNVRGWNLTPQTVYGMTPVKYEDAQNGDTRVGFVADSYVNSLPELVEMDPNTGEVEGWRYLLTCVAQQVAIRDLNERLKTTETMLEGVLERLADLETGTL